MKESMEEKDLEEEIEKLDRQMLEIRRRRDELLKESDEHFLQYARKNIGRCFKLDTIYAKVIGIPEEKLTLHGNSLDRYEYPAVFINTDSDSPYPIEYNTIFAGHWEDAGNCGDEEYIEVSEEEFNDAFITSMEHAKHDILSIHKEER